MGEFVASKWIFLFGFGVLAVCMFVSISLAQAFTSLEQRSEAPLFPRSALSFTHTLS